MLRIVWSILERFRRANDGNIAMIGAGVIVTVIAGTGAMTDYGRAHTVRGALQSSLDAAVISAAWATLDDHVDAASEVANYLQTNWGRKHGVTNPTLESFTFADSQLQAVASAKVPSTFLGVLGVDMIDVSVVSQVNFGLGNLEVALVLDNTGSMAGSKIQNLASSAQSLVDTLMSDVATNNNIKIGVVPFANYVNVGLQHRSASWIIVPTDYSEDSEQCSTSSPVVSQTNCTTMTGNYNNDGATVSYDYQSCDTVYGDPVTTCNIVTTNHVWNGCVGSRDHPANVDDAATGTIPGLLDTTCSTPLLPLTAAKADVDWALNQMGASGDTYIPAGLIWGWRLLSDIEPFTEAAPYGAGSGGETVRKVIVLMTDGANTRSPTYPDHDGSNSGKANTLTAEVCTKIKASGIEIYALTFDVNDNGIKTLMEDCASGPPFYFDAANAMELTEAFRNIGTKLIKMRLAG